MLAAVAWREEFRVGVTTIDEQHRRLVDMLGGFYGALAATGQSKAALGVLLGGLVEYTRYHFTTEEQLMEQTRFPALRAHRQQHAGFVQKVSEMAERHARNGVVLSIEATSFLREWLFNHILVTDRELGRYLVSRGIR